MAWYAQTTDFQEAEHFTINCNQLCTAMAKHSQCYSAKYWQFGEPVISGVGNDILIKGKVPRFVLKSGQNEKVVVIRSELYVYTVELTQ